MKTIAARVQFEGVHNWPEAPYEVSFLRQPHRHIFGVTAEVEVFKNDREIEFIMLGHRLKQFFKEKAKKDPNGVWQMGRTSCEDVANEVVGQLEAYFCGDGHRYIIVTVDEDGENFVTVDNGVDSRGVL